MKRFTINKLVAWFLGLATALPALDWFWVKFVSEKQSSAIWALTVVASGCVFWVFFLTCQRLLDIERNEVERCARAKKLCEEIMLKNRISSARN